MWKGKKAAFEVHATVRMYFSLSTWIVKNRNQQYAKTINSPSAPKSNCYNFDLC
jgi:hypothetical protein